MKWKLTLFSVLDSRGVAARPNAAFELRHWRLDGKIVPASSADQGVELGVRMAVWAGPHGIKKGEEILVSYGRGFWSERRKEAEADKVEEEAS